MKYLVANASTGGTMPVSLYVGNLNYQVGEADLVELFRPYGAVIRARIPLDRATNRSRGFGFVEMEHDAADRAVRELNASQFFGRSLVVNPTHPRPTPGRYA